MLYLRVPLLCFINAVYNRGIKKENSPLRGSEEQKETSAREVELLSHGKLD